MVFIAGQTVKSGTFDEQAAAVFDNVKSALTDAGVALHNTVKITVFVKDYSIDKRSVVRANVQRIFKRALPASSLVGVSELADPESLIEVEAQAVI